MKSIWNLFRKCDEKILASPWKLKTFSILFSILWCVDRLEKKFINQNLEIVFRTDHKLHAVHVKLFFKWSSGPLSQWFQYGHNFKLTKKSMFENFLSYPNNQGEEFIIDLKKFHEDNSEQIKHFVPGQMCNNICSDNTYVMSVV